MQINCFIRINLRKFVISLEKFAHQQNSNSHPKTELKAQGGWLKNIGNNHLFFNND